ncbi:hypothetical protein GCM10028784_29500 [Myceligenerans cantabricum]
MPTGTIPAAGNPDIVAIPEQPQVVEDVLAFPSRGNESPRFPACLLKSAVRLVREPRSVTRTGPLNCFQQLLANIGRLLPRPVLEPAASLDNGKAVLILITHTQVTVIDRATHQTLATNTIDPTRSYWRNNEREPGRWPGPRNKRP